MKALRAAPGQIADDDKRVLEDYTKALATLVEAYETKLYPQTNGSGIDALKFLMEVNNLTQASLTEEIGQQPQVSRILNGERPLTREHIENLAKRFNVSPALLF